MLLPTDCPVFISGLKLNIIPLIDPIGPVGTEETYQCLVVTKETKRGGSMINSIREEGGLKPVDVHVVDLVLDDDFASAPEKGDNEHKLSSTAERQKLLGNLLRPVVQKENIVGRPYVIGVTGGIACGKSSVCQRLKGLGAAIINCDQLGHCAYAPGKKAYKEIIANFGPDVLTPEKTINRKALGSIVFADNSKLALLNQIVWPEILVQVESEISRHGQAGFKVCVLDAAILLEAGWDKVTNEVWVVFVPEAEALSRILSRDGLTEKQALNRIRSQLGNEERLAKANVAICTLWEPECTQQQVEKAWTRLQKTVQ